MYLRQLWQLYTVRPLIFRFFNVKKALTSCRDNATMLSGYRKPCRYVLEATLTMKAFYCSFFYVKKAPTSCRIVVIPSSVYIIHILLTWVLFIFDAYLSYSQFLHNFFLFLHLMLSNLCFMFIIYCSLYRPLFQSSPHFLSKFYDPI